MTAETVLIIILGVQCVSFLVLCYLVLEINRTNVKLQDKINSFRFSISRLTKRNDNLRERLRTIERIVRNKQVSDE